MAKMQWKSSSEIFEEEKRAKKEQLSKGCQDAILGGFEVEIAGETYHFSYDREAQINYSERWQLFQNDMIEEISMTAHTLNGEDVRFPVDREMFDKIYLASVEHKEDKIRKLREDLFPLVDNSKASKDLESISWELNLEDPKPQAVKLKDDKTVKKELKRIEIEGAESSSEMMNLIIMTQMGMM